MTQPRCSCNGAFRAGAVAGGAEDEIDGGVKGGGSGLFTDAPLQDRWWPLDGIHDFLVHLIETTGGKGNDIRPFGHNNKGIRFLLAKKGGGETGRRAPPRRAMNQDTSSAEQANSPDMQRLRRRRAIVAVQVMVILLAAVSIFLAIQFRSYKNSAPAAKPGSEAAAALDLAGLTVTEQTVRSAPTSPVVYTINAQFPVISGHPDADRQKEINALLRAPADQAIAGFTNDFGNYPPGSGDNGFATVEDHVYRAGRLIAVRFDTTFRFPGARSINSGANALTIRLDNGEVMSARGMLTAHGLSTAGISLLAIGMQTQPDIVECYSHEGYGPDTLKRALTKFAEEPDQSGVAVNPTQAGLQFSFRPGAIGPNICGIVGGVLTFAQLSGLVEPSLVALATAA